MRTRAKPEGYETGYETVVTWSLGLIFGLFYGLIFWPFYGLIFGLIGGLIVGLIVVVGVVLDHFWKSPGRNCKGTYHSWRALLVDEVCSIGSIGARVGGCVGAILGFVVGCAMLGVWAVIGLIIGSLIGWPIGGLLIGGIVALIFTVIICLAKFGEVVLGADSLDEITLVEAIGWKWSRIWKMHFPQWVRVDKASPNQGINLSRNNSLAVFLVSGIITGLTVGLIFGLMKGLMNGLIAGIIVGLTAGLLLGLNGGGSAVIKHYFLRLFLWLKGYTPFRFVKFLDCCAQLILLKKVGGGYIFTHRMLLEYFAEMNPSRTGKQI